MQSEWNVSIIVTSLLNLLVIAEARKEVNQIYEEKGHVILRTENFLLRRVGL